MQQDFSIIKLHFSGPLHLAKGKSDYASSQEILHSDTIKSALFVAAVQSGHGVNLGQTSEEGYGKNEFLDSFNISSAFPFYGDEYFFPKPICETHEIWEKGEPLKKGRKDILFIGQSYFEEILNKKGTAEMGGGKLVFQNKIEHHTHTHGKFASESMPQLSKASDFYIMSEDNVMMHVTVPRHYETEKDNPRPYYVERIFFPQEGGLYFFIEILDEKYRTVLENALEMLGENGIGTDRNVGNGQFFHDWQTLSMDLPENATHRVMLSLYCPKNTEMDAAKAQQGAYTLLKRGGYISSPEDEDKYMSFRKRSIYMFAEGSILPGTKQSDYKGELLDLRPEAMQGHPVWRDGRAFSLPINPIWND